VCALAVPERSNVKSNSAGEITRETQGTWSKKYIIKKYFELGELCTTMLENLRGLGKFSKIRNTSDSDIPPAKAPRTLSSDKYFFLFAAFASLREIIRNSVAASLRWALCG